jgi:hypothetical protein
MPNIWFDAVSDISLIILVAYAQTAPMICAYNAINAEIDNTFDNSSIQYILQTFISHNQGRPTLSMAKAQVDTHPPSPGADMQSKMHADQIIQTWSHLDAAGAER